MLISQKPPDDKREGQRNRQKSRYFTGEWCVLEIYMPDGKKAGATTESQKD